MKHKFTIVGLLLAVSIGVQAGELQAPAPLPVPTLEPESCDLSPGRHAAPEESREIVVVSYSLTEDGDLKTVSVTGGPPGDEWKTALVTTLRSCKFAGVSAADRGAALKGMLAVISGAPSVKRMKVREDGKTICVPAAMNYPSNALRNGYEGSAVVRLEANLDGRLLLAEIVGSSGHSELDSATLLQIGGCDFPAAPLSPTGRTRVAKTSYRWSIRE